MITKFFRCLFSKQTAQVDMAFRLARAQSEIAELQKTVFDLLVEIEALRETVLKSPLGSGGKDSPYARAYQRTAFLTHDSTGPYGGHQKLISLFHPRDDEEGAWRECLFMRRLGLSAEDISRYMGEAKSAETYT